MPRASAIVSTVFGIGYFPAAQGTIMSAAAVPTGILIAMYGGGAIGLAGAAMIALAIGVVSCNEYVRDTGNPDPSECVIDELAGQWVACAFVAFPPFGSILPFALAFGLFLLFDIWKPWPVSWAEEKLPGGLGVMMDDIVAGVMAGIICFIVHYYQWL